MRDILAFDGEAQANRYILLADSDGHEIVNLSGLALRQCVDFLTRPELTGRLCIWYSFNYDVNEMFGKITDIDFWRGRRAVKLGEIRIKFTPGKKLELWRNGRKFTHYDVFGFFQKSFTRALRDWLNVDDSLINAGKAARSEFDRWPLADIRRYNQRELLHLAALGEKLVDIFSGLDWLTMRSWHGAGAAGQAALTSIRLENELDIDPRAETLGQEAYYGGRVETLQRGCWLRPVYRYDLRSAYPFAMSLLPDLSQTSWTSVKRFNPRRLGIYRVKFELPLDSRMGVLPVRGPDGLITFPLAGRGTYWSTELVHVLSRGGRLEIEDGLVASGHAPASRLSALVKRLYQLRREYRAAGDGREKAVKLILNSLYGKLAQKRHGRFHSYALAGLITSYTRSALLGAVTGHDSAVIAFATDAVFTTRRLALPLSDALGDWEEARAPQHIQVMNGIYRFGDEAKSRGFHLTTERFNELYEDILNKGYYLFEERSYVTRLLSLTQPLAHPTAGAWQVSHKIITPEGDRKRLWLRPFSANPGGSLPLPGDISICTNYYRSHEKPELEELLIDESLI